MKLTEFIIDVGRPVAYYPGLRSITGSATATILLCQLLYWVGKETNTDGWIYKSSAELEDETGLSYREQKTARTKLIKAGLLEEQHKRLEHKIYFRPLLKAIDEHWRNAHPVVPEPRDARLGKRQTRVSLNESENTTENTTNVLPTGNPAVELSEQQKMFGAIAEATIMDGKANAGRIGRSSRVLLKAGYTPDQVERLYGTHGWWYQADWRGQKGQPPTPEEICNTIRQGMASDPAPKQEERKARKVIFPSGHIAMVEA